MAQTQCNEGQANPVVRVGKEKNETNTHHEKNLDGTFTWKTKHDMRTATKKLASPCPAPLRIIGSCTHVVNSLFSLSFNYKRALGLSKPCLTHVSSLLYSFQSLRLHRVCALLNV